MNKHEIIHFDFSDFLLKNLFIYLTKGFSLIISTYLLFISLNEISYVVDDNVSDQRNSNQIKELNSQVSRINTSISLNILVIASIVIHTITEGVANFWIVSKKKEKIIDLNLNL